MSLDAVKNAPNELLRMSNIEPVQVRAGLDDGRLDFVRIGSPAGSEVNVLGFAATFASKCEKAALAWEVVAGQELASLLPDDDLTHHASSPTLYTRNAEKRAYRYYDVALHNYLCNVRGVAEQLAGHPVSAVEIR